MLKVCTTLGSLFIEICLRQADRSHEVSVPETVAGWVGFDFPGRGEKYSSMKYNHQHFNGVDWDESRKKHAIYRIANKDWAKDVSDENGNYDYLMFANLDHTNDEVRNDIFKWAIWLGNELPISGMRIDAAKHYSTAFQKDFVDHLRRTVGSGYFLVAEYWRGEVKLLLKYLEAMHHQVSVFDVPLLGRFSAISKTKGGDLRKIFRGTVVEQRPSHAVVSLHIFIWHPANSRIRYQTFVGNHDTVSFQSPETSRQSSHKEATRPITRSMLNKYHAPSLSTY